jgi:hypothetical protein
VVGRLNLLVEKVDDYAERTEDSGRAVPKERTVGRSLHVTRAGPTPCPLAIAKAVVPTHFRAGEFGRFSA